MDNLIINCAVIGYGNLGRACREQILKRPDEFNLAGVFSRRKVQGTIPLDKLGDYRGEIDVALFCGGSADDAPEMVPYLNKLGLSTVDSYDNHGAIAEYINTVKAATETSGTTAIAGAGWDPGYLSVQRILCKALMPNGTHNVFYGGKKGGLSMGHSNAIKTVPGVVDACQFTLTRPDSLAAALRGKNVPANDKHKRLCYVVAKPGKENAIATQIRGMAGYFKDQITQIRFVTPRQLEKIYTQSHSGHLISTDDNAKINLELTMKSNPLFTANAMLAYAKANKIMQQKGQSGVFTCAEVPPAYLVGGQTYFEF